jgi:hypothetical protein
MLKNPWNTLAHEKIIVEGYPTNATKSYVILMILSINIWNIINHF